MDRPLSILLVEDEPDECQLFVQCVEALDDVNLVGVTNSSSKALEHVKDFMPDAIILDLELHKGSGSGVAFLSALDIMQCQKVPYVFITTNNISRTTHEHVRQLGADFIMVKSQADYSAEVVIEFLRSLKNMLFDMQKRRQDLSEQLEALPPSEMKKRLTARVTTEIDQIGISPKAVGRSYLIDAIMMKIDDQPSHITAIAHKYGKTDASVERAMQNAINNAWRTGDIDDLHRLYTARIVSDKGVPTHTEFIYYYANKMKIEY